MKPWNNNANGGPRKRAWTPVEDEQLQSVVLAGPIKWSAVAELIGTRNAKQCRERWHYQLNPEIKKGRWTADEDALISNLPHGDWARVAKELPGRTDMAIKNRYHTLTKRKCSAAARRRGHGAAKSRTQPYDDDDEDEDAMADDDDAPDRAREYSPTPDEGVQPARKRRCNSNSTTATNEQAPVVSVQSSASSRSSSASSSSKELSPSQFEHMVAGRMQRASPPKPPAYHGAASSASSHARYQSPTPTRFDRAGFGRAGSSSSLAAYDETDAELKELASSLLPRRHGRDSDGADSASGSSSKVLERSTSSPELAALCDVANAMESKERPESCSPELLRVWARAAELSTPEPGKHDRPHGAERSATISAISALSALSRTTRLTPIAPCGGHLSSPELGAAFGVWDAVDARARPRTSSQASNHNSGRPFAAPAPMLMRNGTPAFASSSYGRGPGSALGSAGRADGAHASGIPSGARRASSPMLMSPAHASPAHALHVPRSPAPAAPQARYTRAPTPDHRASLRAAPPAARPLAAPDARTAPWESRGLPFEAPAARASSAASGNSSRGAAAGPPWTTSSPPQLASGKAAVAAAGISNPLAAYACGLHGLGQRLAPTRLFATAAGSPAPRGFSRQRAPSRGAPTGESGDLVGRWVAQCDSAGATRHRASYSLGEVTTRCNSLDGTAYWRLEWRAGARQSTSDLAEDTALRRCTLFDSRRRALREVELRTGAAIVPPSPATAQTSDAGGTDLYERVDGGALPPAPRWSAAEATSLKRKLCESAKDLQRTAAELRRPVGDVLHLYYGTLKADATFKAQLKDAMRQRRSELAQQQHNFQVPQACPPAAAHAAHAPAFPLHGFAQMLAAHGAAAQATASLS